MQRTTTAIAAPARAEEHVGAVYAPAWRLAIAALRTESRAGLLFVLGLLVFDLFDDMTPGVTLRAVTVLAALPALAAWLLERAFAARVVVDDRDVVVHARGRRLEIPRDAVADAVPWRVPLPRPGLTLRLRSGRRLAIATDDPGALLPELGAGGACDAPVVRWAAARAARGPTSPLRLLARYPLFGLVPGAILFRTHQWIAYGGTLGEYYLLGLRAWLTTFATYWITVTVYLVLWGNLWRVLAETVTLLTARVAPAGGASQRRGAERAWAILYYAGALALLVLRLLP